MIRVVPIRAGDLEAFMAKAVTFDPKDMADCPDPLKTMQDAISESSQCWICVDDETVVVVCGTMPRPDGGAYFWLLSSADIDAFKFTFAKQTRIFFDELKERYSYITAVVNAKHEQSIRWLRWLGFEFADTWLHPDGRTTFHNVWVKGGKWTQ